MDTPAPTPTPDPHPVRRPAVPGLAVHGAHAPDAIRHATHVTTLHIPADLDVTHAPAPIAQPMTHAPAPTAQPVTHAPVTRAGLFARAARAIRRVTSPEARASRSSRRAARTEARTDFYTARMRERRAAELAREGVSR